MGIHHIKYPISVESAISRFNTRRVKPQRKYVYSISEKMSGYIGGYWSNHRLNGTPLARNFDTIREAEEALKAFGANYVRGWRTPAPDARHFKILAHPMRS